MKKFFLMLSVVISLSFLAACGHSEQDYKTVYDKIQNHEELNADDYSMMLDYIDDTMSAISKVKSEEELEKLEEKYPYAELFVSTMQSSDPSEEIKSKVESKAKKVFENYEKITEEVQKRLNE